MSPPCFSWIEKILHWFFDLKRNLCHQFLSISYWSNSEYWTQKCTQNGKIHSIKLDVYAVKQSASNLSFISSQHKQGRKYHINTMLCPIVINSNTIELTVHTTCYCVLDLLCVSCKTFYFFYFFLNVGPHKEDIFLTTFYGLYLGLFLLGIEHLCQPFFSGINNCRPFILF